MKAVKIHVTVPNLFCGKTFYGWVTIYEDMTAALEGEYAKYPTEVVQVKVNGSWDEITTLAPLRVGGQLHPVSPEWLLGQKDSEDFRPHRWGGRFGPAWFDAESPVTQPLKET